MTQIATRKTLPGWSKSVWLVLDDKLDGNHTTDAILCCPCCFTTLCYKCKMSCFRFVLNCSVRKKSDRRSVAFVSDEVCKCLELFDCGVEVEIKGEDGKPKKVMSYQLVCDVCGNEVGIKRDGKYYLSSVIEENASIWVCLLYIGVNHKSLHFS